MVKAVLEVLSGLSCLGSAGVVICYLCFAHFRKHPSIIVLLLCVSFIFLNLVILYLIKM